MPIIWILMLLKYFNILMGAVWWGLPPEYVEHSHLFQFEKFAYFSCPILNTIHAIVIEKETKGSIFKINKFISNMCQWKVHFVDMKGDFHVTLFLFNELFIRIIIFKIRVLTCSELCLLFTTSTLLVLLTKYYLTNLLVL